MKITSLRLDEPMINILSILRSQLGYTWNQLVKLCIHAFLKTNIVPLETHQSIVTILTEYNASTGTQEHIDAAPSHVNTLHDSLPRIERNATLLGEQMEALVNLINQVQTTSMTQSRIDFLDSNIHIRIDLDLIDEATSFDHFLKTITPKLKEIFEANRLAS